jgi:hypothetical protein
MFTQARAKKKAKEMSAKKCAEWKKTKHKSSQTSICSILMDGNKKLLRIDGSSLYVHICFLSQLSLSIVKGEYGTERKNKIIIIGIRDRRHGSTLI